MVVGITRFNQVADEEMVAQTLSSPTNVVEMYQHHTSEDLTDPQTLEITVFVENFKEDKELLSGHSSSKAMALADKAVNNAVATQFAPYFAADMRGTVEHLRCYLKDACPAVD